MNGDEIAKDRYARPDVTLETCEAVQIYFEPAKLRSIVVWKDGPKLIKPQQIATRIRDLRSGDVVWLLGERMVVLEVEIFR